MSLADEAQKIIDWVESGEEEAHAKFRAMRAVNEETFVRSLIMFVNMLGRRDPALAFRFADKYHLTAYEKGFAEQEVFYTRMMTPEQIGAMEAIHGIEVERSEISRFKIDAKSQIISGAEQLRLEKPTLKPSELKKTVERWTNSIFDKPGKEYTKQQVAAGVNFKLETTKKKLQEKRNGNRSGGTLITGPEWHEFNKKTFGAAHPAFGRQFRADVQKAAAPQLKLIKGKKNK